MDKAVGAVGGGRGLGTHWKPLNTCKDWKTPTKGSQVGTMAETEPRAARWGQWQRSEGGERRTTLQMKPFHWQKTLQASTTRSLCASQV